MHRLITLILLPWPLVALSPNEPWYFILSARQNLYLPFSIKKRYFLNAV